MTPDPLRILVISPIPPSPPWSGGQARMHGLAKSLARTSEVSVASLLPDGFDREACARALAEYCQTFVLVPNLRATTGLQKRLVQIRSLASPRSYERQRFTAPGFQEALDQILRAQAFDAVFVHFAYLAHYRVRQAPGGARPPVVVIDSHDVGYDLQRQVARRPGPLGRRAYAALNWRKLWREERNAYEGADGVCVCSTVDQARLAEDVPRARTVVIPNAADVDYFKPRPTDPAPDGETVLFFGLLSTVPNVDGVLFFLKEIWPRIAAARPRARCKVVGANPPPAVRALAGPRVEITGVVEDLRPHLASAAAVVVPLRIGSGTRLKIVEAWAMGKALVSTTLGAEGIDGVPERDLLIADEPTPFADAVIRLLDDPGLRERIGQAARTRAVDHYSWNAAAERLTSFFREARAGR